MNFAINGRHLADQDYIICMRQAQGNNTCTQLLYICTRKGKINPQYSTLKTTPPIIKCSYFLFQEHDVNKMGTYQQNNYNKINPKFQEQY